jgi:hypothetical protein
MVKIGWDFLCHPDGHPALVKEDKKNPKPLIPYDGKGLILLRTRLKDFEKRKNIMTDYSSVLIIFLVLGGIGIALFLSARMTKRAVGRVIAIFQKYNAIGIQQAKTVNEMGLTPPSLMDRFTRMRDYKQNALSILMKANIVQTTEEGKLFISAEKLAELKSKGIGK